jgi:hypothetical protein
VLLLQLLLLYVTLHATQALQQLEADIDAAGALYDRLDKADTRLQLVAKHVSEGGPYIELQCSQLLQEAQQVSLVS